jgi:hypothetical protein
MSTQDELWTALDDERIIRPQGEIDAETLRNHIHPWARKEACARQAEGNLAMGHHP